MFIYLQLIQGSFENLNISQLHILRSIKKLHPNSKIEDSHLSGKNFPFSSLIVDPYFGLFSTQKAIIWPLFGEGVQVFAGGCPNFSGGRRWKIFAPWVTAYSDLAHGGLLLFLSENHGSAVNLRIKNRLHPQSCTKSAEKYVPLPPPTKPQNPHVEKPFFGGLN